MKVYLTAPSDRVKRNRKLYNDVLGTLNKQKFRNTNDYIELLTKNKKIKISNNVYRETIKKVKQADLVVADISLPSISVGSIIEYALKGSIPSLYLCEDRLEANIPTILLNDKSALRTKLIYSRKNVTKLLANFLKDFQKNKIKFNVFIDVEINNYLQWNANKLRTSKSDYFRKLIREKMKSDSKYNKKGFNTL